MPNWCINQLRVTCEKKHKDILGKFKEKAKHVSCKDDENGYSNPRRGIQAQAQQY